MFQARILWSKRGGGYQLPQTGFDTWSGEFPGWGFFRRKTNVRKFGPHWPRVPFGHDDHPESYSSVYGRKLSLTWCSIWQSLNKTISIKHYHFLAVTFPVVDPGGPVVIIFASGSEVRGFVPSRGPWIFQSVKILSMTSFGREVKSWALCRRFTAGKITSIRN